jgi:hypothetical protein
MSQIICLNEKCPHRSKKPLRKWGISGGKKAYSCTLPVTIIAPMFDCDNEVQALYGYLPCECRQYMKDKEKELIDNEHRETET